MNNNYTTPVRPKALSTEIPPLPPNSSSYSSGGSRAFSPISYGAFSTAVRKKAAGAERDGTQKWPEIHRSETDETYPSVLSVGEDTLQRQQDQDFSLTEQLQHVQQERDLYMAALENMTRSLAVMSEELKSTASGATKSRTLTEEESMHEIDSKKHEIRKNMQRLLAREDELSQHQEPFVNSDPDSKSEVSGVVLGVHRAFCKAESGSQMVRHNLDLQSKDYETTLHDLQTMLQKAMTMKEVTQVLHERNAQETMKRKKLQKEKNMLVKECKRLTASLSTESHERRALVDEHMAMSVTLHEQSLMAPGSTHFLSKSKSMDEDALSPLPNTNRFKNSSQRRTSCVSFASRYENPPSIIFDSKSFDRDLDTVTFGTLTPTLSLDDEDDQHTRHSAMARSFLVASPTKSSTLKPSQGTFVQSISERIESISPLSLQPGRNFMSSDGSRNRARTTSADAMLNLPSLEEKRSASPTLLQARGVSPKKAPSQAPFPEDERQDTTGPAQPIAPKAKVYQLEVEASQPAPAPTPPVRTGFRGFLDFVDAQK